jgi:superfamily II DNA or RNA helicase
MGCVLPIHQSVTTLRQRTRVTARQLEVRMLVIDEIHSILAGTFREQRIFLNAIRFLAPLAAPPGQSSPSQPF